MTDGIVLGSNQYGKAENRVVRVYRDTPRHSIRDLNVYHRWSPFQLEGEITAKIHIPSNQIERVEWWDLSSDATASQRTCTNPGFVTPAPILNVREHF